MTKNRDKKSFNNSSFLMRHSVYRVKIMVEKVTGFSAESLCLRQGMVTSGRWCHMILLDHLFYSYLSLETTGLALFSM